MPFGEFQYSVDDKGRVIIPPSFREFVDDGMVVTRGIEGCIWVFPLSSWRNLEAQLTNLPITDAPSRNFIRFFYSGAAKAATDSAGRITVPQTLRTFAGVGDGDNSVVIAGAPNRLEIWNEARWLSALTEVQNNPPVPELLKELVG